MSRVTKFWSENKGFIVFLFLMLFFRSAIADWYHVPTGSMQPSILIGDRVYVNKLAYDVKVPFSSINLSRRAEPQRGDVVVFDSKASDNRLIKRVIGVPGDLVEMKNNQLFINGQPLKIQSVQYPSEFDRFLNDRQIAGYYQESLENESHILREHFVRVRLGVFSQLSSFPAVEVPEDYLWVMGDNRDNSADSRVIGLVPRSELIGRAESVVISFDKNHYYLPRSDRYSVEL